MLMNAFMQENNGVFPMNITCEIILTELNSDREPHRYCELMLDASDPDIYMQIKDNMELFKNIIKQHPNG